MLPDERMPSLRVEMLKYYADGTDPYTGEKMDTESIHQTLMELINASPAKIVVLDDDPTGVQTVHDVAVYTKPDIDSLRRGFAAKNKVFYLLTNSRGMTVAETTALHTALGRDVARVSEETGIPFILISRSDSTLRGHYPLETQLLAQQLSAAGLAPDGEILCPFFKEGGRYTLNNVHYVLQGSELVPAARTEFAADKTFGYRHSYLPDYIEEKTQGEFKAEDVTCIGLDLLRGPEYDEITRRLMAVTDFNKVVVNAIGDTDLEVFSIGLYRAMAAGKRFVLRSAAGLVKVLGGISSQPLLTREQLLPQGSQGRGGVVVVGSHTAKTTAQLEQLLTLPGTVAVAFNSDAVLQGDEALEEEVARCLQEEEAIIQNGKVAVCYTNRKLLSLPDDTPEAALVRSVKISNAVQSLVGRLQTAPAFVVAKGGITSSDIGTKALQVECANVLGQICPGIPVWRTGSEARFAGIPYVIFPGNTGNEETLKQAVATLTGQQP